MSRYNDFFKEFDKFYVPKRGIEFYESSLEDELIQISEKLDGKLCLLRTTYKLADLKHQFEIKERERFEAYRNATTAEEKKKIAASFGCKEDSRVIMFDDVSLLWFAECGTRKMKSLLVEQFDGDEDFVSELYIIKKLGNYSIAFEKDSKVF